MKFTWNVNIVSLLNLAALVGILISAVGTWYDIRTKVDGLLAFQTYATKEAENLRTKNEFVMGIVRDVQEKQNTKQAVTEIQLQNLNVMIQRLEQTVGRLETAVRAGNAGNRNQ